MCSDPAASDHCCFCGSSALLQTHTGLYHPFKADHGPFSFHSCRDCGAGLTLAPPSVARLSALYGSFRDGLPDLHRTITQDDPQTALYGLCVRRLLGLAGAEIGPAPAWLDVGAGGGELSSLLSAALPGGRGVAIDLHERPELLSGNDRVAWRQVDINADDFASQAGAPVELVVSTAVWEHVVHPDRFVLNLLRLVKPGGVVYLLCPNYGSLARRIMGDRWPYFTPGEHLNIPTAAGARACLARQWRDLHGQGPVPWIRSRALALPYTFRYVFRRLGWDRIGRLLPVSLGMPLPVGALEAVLRAPHS